MLSYTSKSRIDQIEQVIIRILDYREHHAPLRSDRDEYFLRKLSVVVVSYFAIALIKDPNIPACTGIGHYFSSGFIYSVISGDNRIRTSALQCV